MTLAPSFRDYLEDPHRTAFHEPGHWVVAHHIEPKSTQKKPEMFEKDGRWEGRANVDRTELHDIESLYRVAVAGCLAEAKGMGKKDIDVSSIGSAASENE